MLYVPLAASSESASGAAAVCWSPMTREALAGDVFSEWALALLVCGAAAAAAEVSSRAFSSLVTPARGRQKHMRAARLAARGTGGATREMRGVCASRLPQCRHCICCALSLTEVEAAVGSVIHSDADTQESTSRRHSRWYRCGASDALQRTTLSRTLRVSEINGNTGVSSTSASQNTPQRGQHSCAASRNKCLEHIGTRGKECEHRTRRASVIRTPQTRA